jgi:tetratricopeptide (TPR) repeat protein
MALADLGAMVEARSVLRDLARRAGELRQPPQQWLAKALRAQLALLEGRFDEADELIQDAFGEGLPSLVRDHVSVATFQTFLLRREQGRPGEVEDAVRSAVEAFPWYPMFRGALACLLLDLGRPDEAAAALADLDRKGFELVRDNEWLAAVCLLAEATGRLGNQEPARILHRLLSPFEGAHAIGHGEGSLGAVDRYLAFLERCLGRLDDAERHLTASIEANARMGARPWAAHGQHDLADLLLSRDRADDRDRARDLLGAALETCEALGMTALGAKVDALLARHGGVEPVGVAASANELRREGEYFEVRFDDERTKLRDSKGLRYLARLLERPGTEVHALDLVRTVHTADGRSVSAAAIDAAHGWGDAGEVLDERAKVEYRRRVRDLEEDLEEARDWNDPEREARARQELEFLARELAGAVGIGGRDRRAASASERARVNVTRAIRSAIDRLGESAPKLAEHLRATVRTGTFCAYEPDPRVDASWRL